MNPTNARIQPIQGRTPGCVNQKLYPIPIEMAVSTYLSKMVSNHAPKGVPWNFNRAISPSHPSIIEDS